MEGLSLLAELRGCACPRARLHEAATLEALCRAACAEAGLTIVAAAFHGFGTAEAPAGATGAVVLAESHLAVHTWPELDAVTIDLYVCNYSRDNGARARDCYHRLLAAFSPARADCREIARGRLAGEAG